MNYRSRSLNLNVQRNPVLTKQASRSGTPYSIISPGCASDNAKVWQHLTMHMSAIATLLMEIMKLFSIS